MHHFIYPSKDAFITNRITLGDKNFGVDEILQIGTTNEPTRVLATSKNYVYTSQVFSSYNATSFTGIFTGSFGGTIAFANGNISGSGLTFTASYFSGSVDGISQVINGNVSGSLVNGYITGSVTSPYQISVFTGQITGSDVCMTGTGSGVDARSEENWTTTTVKTIDRSLLKFDLTAISTSMANGTIIDPKFSLKVKVCNEYDLPITYTIYALPVSQSWNMGDGYLSDGGSDEGVSWTYRDNNDGTLWYSPMVSGSRTAIDFITNLSQASASFGFGGGTWFTSSICSQSFQYESSDINMDVTPIVMAWYTGSFANEGFLLVHSDELQSTGSGFILKFFSRDTNTIYYPYLDVKWSDFTFTTGSISTGSVTISTLNGITASVQSGSSLTIAGGISGSFSGSAILTLTPNYSASILLSDYSASGFTVGTGLTGNITGIPVNGNVNGTITVASTLVTGPCGKSFTTQLATASFLSGIFSGSTFTAYYVDNKFENAFLTGSWTEAALLGARVFIELPSGIEPYAWATVVGTYVSGRALGTYTISSSTSASFNGQFVTGNLLGGVLSLQLSGSAYTSSYTYTSSVALTSSVITETDTERPFTITLQNVHPIYKAGDMAKIGVFARKQFPLKHFGKSTQQEQYLVPEYLPTSSYYALKDNMTEEIVMDFDNYTQLSCEYPYGNYFIIDTTSLPQDRYYRVLIRVEDGQTVYTFDCGKVFKVTR